MELSLGYSWGDLKAGNQNEGEGLLGKKRTEMSKAGV